MTEVLALSKTTMLWYCSPFRLIRGGIINKQSELIFTKLKKARSEQASRENSLSRADGRDSQVCSQNNTRISFFI